MKIRYFVLSALLIAGCALPLFAAPKKTPKYVKAPALVDFTEWKVADKKWTDKTGNAVLNVGETTGECEGPFGGKALYFDGKKTSVATLDLSKISKNFDGFDYAIAFWFRCDGIQAFRDDARLSGNTPGLGLDMNADGQGAKFNINWYSSGGINTSVTINPGRWNHLAVIYSVERRIMQVYINGFPAKDVVETGVFYPLRQERMNTQQIGMFKGAIADLKIWDKPVPPDDFLMMEMTEKNVKEIQSRIDHLVQEADSVPSAKRMGDVLTGELNKAAADKKISLDNYNTFVKRLAAFEKLVPAVKALNKTSIKDAPFALMQVKAISSEKRVPTKYPTDPVYTTELTGILAKNEYTSVSFLVFPYQDLQKVEFELSDLKGPGGDVIPKDEIELKYVQCWYQAGWNSYFGGYGDYVPSLLLNDTTLLKIDERAVINYLKFHYPRGDEYHNISIPGSVLTYPEFRWAFEPVWDADTLQPVACQFGRNFQMWMDIHAPKNIKAGTYRGKIKIKADGTENEITLAMRVLPFELPLPHTQFDHSKLFTQYLCSSMQIIDLIKLVKDPEIAERMTRENIKNQFKHSIFTQPFALDLNNPEAFVKTLKMHKEIGTLPYFIDGGAGFVSYSLEASNSRTPLEEIATPERIAKDFEKFKQEIDQKIEIFYKYMPKENKLHFFGIDEAQAAGTLRSMAMYRDYIFRTGHGYSMTTGWEDNFENLPSFEVYHTTAAYVDRKNAERWHAIGGQITSYAAPFIGPDNPDRMRKTHGLRMFRHNYDGWWELAYNGGRYHAWNHRFGWDRTYRDFRFLTPTMKGPLINTIAFCGMREGQDDVRYATLMYSLADECFESGKIENILAARKAINWFRDLTMPTPEDMEPVRAGMIHHILTMMKLLNKPII